MAVVGGGVLHSMATQLGQQPLNSLPGGFWAVSSSCRCCCGGMGHTPLALPPRARERTGCGRRGCHEAPRMGLHREDEALMAEAAMALELFLVVSLISSPAGAVTTGRLMRGVKPQLPPERCPLCGSSPPLKGS